MIPYTYTMNRLTEAEGRPLLMPMYYEYPNDAGAYSVGNEYFFGTQLIVAPITRRANKRTHKATVEVWLPEGRYTDIFTDEVYSGGRIVLQRDITSIPVLAPEGAIIPLDGRTKGNECNNPDSLEILIYRGNGSFKLYEDDGESLSYKDGHYAETEFKLEENGDELLFSVYPAEGDLSLIPKSRRYVFSFRDVAFAEKITAVADGREVNFALKKTGRGLAVTVENVESDKGITIVLCSARTKNSSRP